ncbi:MAG: hypothetical protein ACLGIF_04640 [Actinomycetes bacterium]
MITRSLTTGGAVLATALAGAVTAAGPARAADGAEGKVVSKTSLSVRYGPTTAAHRVGTLRSGQTIPLVCKVRGTTVDGNNLWYLLPPTLNEWVSARYVRNVGAAPGWCGTDERFEGRTTTALTKRTGPTRAASSAGVLPSGAKVTIVCTLPGQKVDGNDHWYHLVDGRWVSARYVTLGGRAPGWCTA